jgi:hypothetical protein
MNWLNQELKLILAKWRRIWNKQPECTYHSLYIWIMVLKGQMAARIVTDRYEYHRDQKDIQEQLTFGVSWTKDIKINWTER